MRRPEREIGGGRRPPEDVGPGAAAPFLADLDLGPEPLAACDEELTVVLPSLALGGAERIVLDWAARICRRYAVHVVALGASVQEHAAPPRVRFTRCSGPADASLRALGERLARSRNRLVLCHLLAAAQRAILRAAGACPVPVLHNARAGWVDAPRDVLAEPQLIVVSQAIACELHAMGYRGTVTVIRHIPSMPELWPGMRQHWRRRWGIADEVIVLGMIGGVKPQKAYPRALRLFRDFLRHRPDARLVILGGPAGRDGVLAWEALRAQRARLGLESQVVLPGYVSDATRALPAFDAVLNTSAYEGLSMATLEALQAGVPVVASRVGGQGEIGDPKLSLVPEEAPDEAWTAAIRLALAAERTPAPWTHFPAYRLWTLAQLAAPYAAREHVLFATANLNSGGAQRSLVNLACALRGRAQFTIAVTGGSTTPEFLHRLREAGVEVVRTAAGRDAFDHAEALLRLSRERASDTVAFWNLDAKIKLLVAKFARSWPSVRCIDISPGAYALEELAQTQEFQQRIAFSAEAYFASLATLVHKYAAPKARSVRCATRVIRNGVPAPARVKTDYACGPSPRIVVSGRIAPAKFVTEIVEALALLRERIPAAELHLHGGVEPRHHEYGKALLGRAGGLAGVIFHGADARTPDLLHAYDVALVLGEHQGCPNACLEALAAGVPLVANDSGGTREQVRHNRTGWLLGSTQPAEVAAALYEALTDRRRAARRARAGQRRAQQVFSMAAMAQGYLKLFAELRGG